jgi:hypothetical protein
VMNVCLPGGHFPAVAAAAVHAEHNPAYTRSSVHEGSAATLKYTLKLASTELSMNAVALWLCTVTLHEDGSTTSPTDAKQAVRGTDRELSTEDDTSSTCMC